MNFDHDKKEVRNYDKNRKNDKGLEVIDARNSIFNNVNMCSIAEPFIFTTQAFRLIEDFLPTIQKGLTYI